VIIYFIRAVYSQAFCKSIIPMNHYLITSATNQHYHKNYPRVHEGWGWVFGVMHLLQLPNQTKIISHQFLSVMYVFVRHMYVKTVTI